MRKTMSEMVADFTGALGAARVAVEGKVDGGTSNFDSCVIFSSKDPELERAARQAGLTVFFRTWGKSPGYFLGTPIGAQGSMRTTQAEAMERFLKGEGYDVGMYYQMD